MAGSGSPCGTTTSSGTGAGRPWTTAAAPSPSTAPGNWAAMNGATEVGAIPARAWVNVRPMVTAGFAKDVEEVIQYTAQM